MLNKSIITSFLKRLSSKDQIIVSALRRSILATVPKAEEKILWGGLSYYRPWIGGPIKGALCQITTKHGEIKLEFVHGVHLKDPKHLLQGDRVSKRFITIHDEREVRRSDIKALIKEAAKLNPVQWTVC